MAKIDDSVKKKVPELRFPGFTDDWEERKLGEVGKTKSGIGFPDAQQGGKQGTPFYKVSDMNNPGNEVVMMNANNYASDSQLKENKWNPINPQNSGVVFAKVGAAIFLDRKRIVDTSFLIDNNMMSYLFDSSWNRYFGKTLFEKLRLSRFAQVGALPSFNGSDVEDIKVMIPKESEQKMIGDMFEKLDDTIALHQRKLDLLKEQKKGYLQKMFPKNGAKVPELRFAGFADDWEERKLGEISKYSNGGSYENDVVENGTYELITLKSVNMSGKLVSSGKFINRETKTLEKDTLVMILSEQAPGLLGMTAQIPENNKYVLNQRVAEIKPNTNIDSYFLSMSINRSQVYFSKRGAGTKVQNISKPNVENFEFYCPSEREQQKIGSFFKQLDNTIDLHQRKLDLLKEQKKGFLQKMFAK
ncbi:restriction endonuclease subunit S [Streptococcus agalactiae]|uniref:restriction endonuclease subunit S n=1 Tax=Streptococcus agalactiae TaxID=1311 RepID=UPI0020485D0E|nr:restriction endonuclease subunit S [Streptococcus agalactiae]UOL51519.1 restriction endonuclease subunit S [Streptococcus agalactiae]